MTSPDDAQWRRPAGGEPEDVPPSAGRPAPVERGAAEAYGGGTGYAGPPSGGPPQPGWRPEFIVRPAPPRPLPAQDHPGIDQQEATARTFTYGIGMVAAAVVLLVFCVLCGRALL